MNRSASCRISRVPSSRAIFSKFGVTALLGYGLPMICSKLGYPPTLTSALFALLAFGYLLSPAGLTRKEDRTVSESAPIRDGLLLSSVSSATLVGMIIALLFTMPLYRPLVTVLVSQTQVSWITAWDAIGTILKTAMMAAIFFIVTRWEKRPLESIGWQSPKPRDAFYGVAAFIAVQLVSFVFWPLAFQFMPRARVDIRVGNALYGSLPLSVNLLGAIVNGTAEEVGFRGYALERLSEITASTWLGAGIPYAIEVLCHGPIWGFQGALLQAPRLLVLVLLYLWQRSLPACILAHTLSDVIPIFW